LSTVHSELPDSSAGMADAHGAWFLTAGSLGARFPHARKQHLSTYWCVAAQAHYLPTMRHAVKQLELGTPSCLIHACPCPMRALQISAANCWAPCSTSWVSHRNSCDKPSSQAVRLLRCGSCAVQSVQCSAVQSVQCSAVQSVNPAMLMYILKQQHYRIQTCSLLLPPCFVKAVLGLRGRSLWLHWPAASKLCHLCTFGPGTGHLLG
jgi:hypothetical protein